MSRRRSRPRYLLAVLVLAALTLVTLDARGNGSSALHSVRNDAHRALASVQSGIHDGLRPIGNFLAGTVDYGSLRSENTRLRQDLAAAESSETRAAYLQAQAAQILHASDIPYAGQYRTVVAAVINQQSSNIEASITIGKGTTSGMASGEPVVTPAGLAGVVTDVTATSATVTLISDPSLEIGVDLPGNKVGAASSLGPNEPLAIDVFGSASDIRKGDRLFTSAASQEVPPGIPVGRVSSVTSGTSPTIMAEPFADTANLSYVSVMLTLPQ